jgi:hypothetical protein
MRILVVGLSPQGCIDGRHSLGGFPFIEVKEETVRISKIAVSLGAAALVAGAAGFAAASGADAATVPLINVTVGSSAGGVAGYYGADDGHTHWRYVQAVVTASATLENLNGVASTSLGAVGVTLGNENTGQDAQIGLYDNGGKFGVAYDYGTVSTTYDDPVIEAGLINPDILAAPQLLGNLTGGISVGDRILVSIYYDPTAAGRGGRHVLQFSATDLSKVNEHRSATLSERAISFTEYGIGVVSDASTVTAALNNNLETFTGADVNFYSSSKPAEALSATSAYYGYGGLSQVQYVNTSAQPEIGPDSSLSGASFTVYEGSTTP